MNSKKKHSAHRLVMTEMVVPFWTKSPHRKSVWALTLLLFILMGGLVYSLILLNRWNQGFYDALQRLDQAEFLNQLWRFFFIALGYALIVAYKFYILQSLAIRWRQWLTGKNLNRWLSNKNYYLWQVLPNSADNPDQRLSEDIHELTDLSLEIGEKVLREMITFVSFIGILWGLSSSLNFQLGAYHVEVYKYLVWACLLYAAIGTWITHKIGFPLSKLNFMQQKFEADFRYMLVRLRENSEGIALSKGEAYEKQKLSNKFSQVVANFKDIIGRQKRLLVTTNIYGQFAYIFPFVVASPKVFTKEITLGQLFQISSAFGQVQGSVSVFVDMYAKIMRLNSVILRLGGFLISIQKMSDASQKPLAPGKSAEITAAELSVFTPTKHVLFSGLNLQVHAGERVLLIAASGTGKSTLIRTLSGLWPYAEGQISAPTSDQTMVLPQKAYLPLGTLKDALTYPDSSQDYGVEVLKQALHFTQLSYLEKSLDDEDSWSTRLSVGEQQRLCFARLFVRKPNLIFLDEATSGVEKELEMQLFKNLTEQLPNATVLTFSHSDEALKSHHHRTVFLNKN